MNDAEREGSSVGVPLSVLSSFFFIIAQFAIKINFIFRIGAKNSINWDIFWYENCPIKKSILGTTVKLLIKKKG